MVRFPHPRGACRVSEGMVSGNSVEVRELSPDAREARFGEILRLYETVGWASYTARPEALRSGYAGSLAVWGAFLGDELIGVVRVVGDGETIVFVQDLIVAPPHQRKGVGTRLMRAVMERFSGVYQMELLTDDAPTTCAFYESLGFARSDAMGCVAYVRASRHL